MNEEKATKSGVIGTAGAVAAGVAGVSVAGIAATAVSIQQAAEESLSAISAAADELKEQFRSLAETLEEQVRQIYAHQEQSLTSLAQALEERLQAAAADLESQFQEAAERCRSELKDAATDFGPVSLRLEVAADGKSAILFVTPPPGPDAPEIVVHLGAWAAEGKTAPLKKGATWELKITLTDIENSLPES